MEVGENIAIICTDSIADPIEKKSLLKSLEETDKKIIEVTFDQMYRFAGNMLQLKDRNGNLVLVMSEQGYRSLTTQQVKEISSVSKILYSNIEHIERFGGGSARCMIAEIFNGKVS